MNFQEAFQLLLKGKTLTIEDMEYRLGSNYPPSIISRPKGDKNHAWAEEMKGYFLFNLASDLWEISNENPES